jgi:hypothetical protein
MDETSSMHWQMRYVYKIVNVNLTRRDHFGDLCWNWKVTVECILKK